MNKKGLIILTFVLVAVFLFSAHVFAEGKPPGMIKPNTPNGCWQGGYQGSPYQCWVSPWGYTYEDCGDIMYYHCYVIKDISFVMDFHGPDYCFDPCPE